jgi:DNA-binding transcriptional ArsR family regulator
MNELWRVFFALGDAHRLTMIRRLAEGGPLPIVRLTDGMEFSRQAGAKHVGVLREAGLVSLRRAGREQIVSLEPANLHLSRMFMRQMEEAWDDRLARLTAMIER